ncbi:MAG: TetR/AcrR family transcriptional regulator [Rhodothermales bacterium]
MSKGAETRKEILARTVGLFNKHGYAGVSMAQVMEVTGLKKGGIYNHFESKEQLALEVFDFAISKVRERFIEGLRGKKTAIERLHAIPEIMARYVSDPPVEGGCPVHNTAVDSTYTHPALQQRARIGMDELQNYIRITVEKGIARNELPASMDADDVAAIMLSTLEGALMMSKLYNDEAYMSRAVNHLRVFIDGQVTA